MIRKQPLPIAREGWPFIAPALLLSLLSVPFDRRVAGAALGVAAIMAGFFRDPERSTPPDPGALYAPADGHILRVESVDSPAGIGVPAWRVAIFLSLFDVHINRSPAAGVVRRCVHTPGRFRSAWDPGVELTNEHTTIDIETERGPVRVVQIAGLVARRIVTYPEPGCMLQQGERIGLIKFSSRTDVIFPAALARPVVRPGQPVRGGETPLGRYD
jgi:phosphatidylserine decarboxylase